MPRFFFNVRDGEHVVRDCEGQELSDLIEGEFEARLAARDMIIEQLEKDESIDGREIEIADASGAVLLTVKIRDVLKNDISSE
jgi:hypothetical protein